MLKTSGEGTAGKLLRVAIASLMLAGCLLILTVLLVATFESDWIPHIMRPASLALLLGVYAIVSVPLAHRYFGS